jgi:uncharacterized protein YggE
LLFVIAVVMNSTSYAAEKENPHMITVQGVAEVKVVPDEVVITIGNETANKNVKEAISKNDEQIKKLMDTIKKAGVEQKYIQTSTVSVRPEYREDHIFYGKANAQAQAPPQQIQETTAENRIKYFIAQKTIVITLKDTKKVEELLSNIYETGVTNVQGVDFRTTELRKHRDRARDMAMKAAKEKAEAMAGAIGQKIGKALFINENSVSHFNPFGNNAYNAQNSTVPTSENPADSEGTISLGQISVNATVTVQFELP